jgi:glutathione synthase/RimK-type ligase-like ATP-grasp enzyme
MSMRTMDAAPVIGLAGLGRLMEAGNDISVLGPQLEARVANDPADAGAMLDIATLCFLTQNPDNVPFALQYQSRALKLQQVYRLPAPSNPALRLLVIMAPGDNTSNTPVDCLLERSDIEITLLYALDGQPLSASLPDHDVVFVAVGESKANHVLLQSLDALRSRTNKAIINAPEHIVRTLRDDAADRLGSIPGVLMPPTVRVARSTLQAVGRSAASLRDIRGIGQFPVIVRPVDSQGGKQLAKVDSPAELAAYLGEVNAIDFFLSSFVDYRSADGQFRKCRVVLVDGRPFAVHMGISDHWMIHYVNAGMSQSADKRRDEQVFFETFDRDFAVRHATSLAAIHERLGLEYVTLDCADAPDGRLLVFEVDNAAIVHDLDDSQLYPYKRPAMQRVFEAFRAMLMARTQTPSGTAVRS